MLGRMQDIETLREIRGFVRRLTDDLSDEQLEAQPPGASNHVLWNLGHLAVTQQLLHYKLSGLPMYLPDEVVDGFRKGTSPTDWNGSPPASTGEIREWLVELPERLAEDHAAGRFETFHEYPTSTGIVLHTLDEALAFNNFHEGIHAGIMIRLMKSL
jgi:DinB superfamily